MDFKSFLLALVLWELVNALLKAALRRIGRSAWFHRVVPDSSARDTLVKHGPTYAKSTLHAVLVGARGWRHLWMMWDAPAEMKLQIMLNGGAVEQLIPGEARIIHESIGVLRTNVVLGGYLASDLLHVIMSYPELGGVDTVAHHMVFLLCSWVAGLTRAVPFMFGWLIVGECSTPFLNARWMLIKARHTNGPLFAAVQYAFVLSFIFLRFFIYGAGLAHHIYMLAIGTPVHVSGTAMALIVALVGGGFIINIVWISKIIAVLKRGGKKKVAVTDMHAPADVLNVVEEKASKSSDPVSHAE